MQETSTTIAGALTCPSCSAPLAPEEFESGEVFCPGCRSPLSGAIFPAFWRARPARLATGEIAQEGEAACFFHPEKRADIACERCGRFVCALCAVELGGRSLCGTCLGQSLGNEKAPELVTSRILWTVITFWVGVLPVPLALGFLPLLIFTGSAAVFLGIYGWKKPGSLVHGPRRWAAGIGILGGLAQLAIFIGFVLLVWRGKT